MQEVFQVLSRTAVILNRPIYPRNIGMCARAMGNLGCNNLHIVAPRCDLQSREGDHEMRQGATHAGFILDQAQTHTTLNEYLEKNGKGVRIGLTAREGTGRRVRYFSELLTELAEDPTHPIFSPSTLIQLHFGTEDDGMSLEELAPMNFLCRLPSTAQVSSYNLSHAVLMALATLGSHPSLTTENRAIDSKQNAHSTVPSGRLAYPRRAIREWLEALNFDLESRKISIETSLNRVLLSHCPTDEDLRLLEKVLFQTVEKLKQHQVLFQKHNNTIE